MKPKRVPLISFILLVVFSGCNNVQNNAPTISDATQAVYPTPRISEKITETENPTQTVLPIVETVNPTASPIVIEYSTEYAKTRVVELLETNANCALPCWWELTPGQSSITQVDELIATISDDVKRYQDHRHNIFIISAIFPYDYEDPQIRLSSLDTVFYFRNDLLFMLESGSVYQLSAQQLSSQEFLSKFGDPDEIWVRTYSHVREPESWELLHWPFEMVLFYKTKGIAIMLYHGDAEEENGEKITACPNQWYTISVFEPDLFIGFQDFLRYSEYFAENGWEYVPLLDATGLQIEEFVENARADQNFCISTPKNLWPQQ